MFIQATHLQQNLLSSSTLTRNSAKWWKVEQNKKQDFVRNISDLNILNNTGYVDMETLNQIRNASRKQVNQQILMQYDVQNEGQNYLASIQTMRLSM